MANEQEFFDKQVEQDLYEEQLKNKFRQSNNPQVAYKRRLKDIEDYQKEQLFHKLVDNFDEYLPQFTWAKELQKGTGDSINEIYKFITQTDQGPIPASELSPATTTGGAIAREIGHFSTMFIPLLGQVGRATQAVPWLAKLGKSSPRFKNAIDGLIAGAGTDFASYDPNTENLANVIANSIESYPQAKKLIATYLATDKNNSQLENRFKNALVGMIIGTGIEGAFATAGAIKTSAPKIADYIISLKNEHPEAIKKFLEPLKNERGAIDLDKFQFHSWEPPEDFGNIPKETLGMNYKDILEYEKELEESKKRVKERAELFTRSEISNEEFAKFFDEKADQTPYTPTIKLNPEDVANVEKKLLNNDFLDLDLVKNINLDRLNTPDQIKGIIGQLAEDFESSGLMARLLKGDKEGVLTQKLVKQQAELIGADPNSLFKDTELLPARMLAARNLMVRSAEHLNELGEKFIVSQSPEDQVKMRFHNIRHGAIFAQVTGSATNIARTMTHMRILAQADKARLGAVNQLSEMWGDAEVNLEFAKSIVGLYKKGLKNLNRFSEISPLLITKNSIIGANQNGLLSSPETFERNFIGNAIAMGESLFERKLAEGRTKKLEASGQDTSNLVQPGEAKAMWTILKSSLDDASEVFHETFKTGRHASGVTKSDFFESQQELMDLDEESLKNLNPLIRGFLFLSQSSDVIGKGLTSMDEAMKFINYRMHITGKAYRKAYSEADGDMKKFTYLFNRYKRYPSEETENFAREFAIANAFQDKTKPFKETFGRVESDIKTNIVEDAVSSFGGAGMDVLASGARWLQKQQNTWEPDQINYGVNDGLGKWFKENHSAIGKNTLRGLSKLVIPFVNTPFQLLDRGVALTPLARQASIRFRKQLTSPDPAERQMLESKISASQYLFWTFLAGTLFNDGITGAPSSNYNKSKYDKEVAPPYSVPILFTNHRFNYDQADPISYPLAVAANTANLIKRGFKVGFEELNDPENTDLDQELLNIVLTFAGEMGDFMLDRNYLKNVNDFYGLVFNRGADDIENKLHRVGDNVIRAIPPNSYFSGLRKTATKLIDPFEKETHDNTFGGELLNKVVSGIPFASTSVPNKKGLLGEDLIAGSASSSQVWNEHNNNLNVLYDHNVDMLEQSRSVISSPFHISKVEQEPIYENAHKFNITYRHPSSVKAFDSVELNSIEKEYFQTEYGRLNDLQINQPLKFNKYFSPNMNDRQKQIRLHKGFQNTYKSAKGKTINKFPRLKNEIFNAKKNKMQEIRDGKLAGSVVDRQISDSKSLQQQIMERNIVN